MPWAIQIAATSFNGSTSAFLVRARSRAVWSESSDVLQAVPSPPAGASSSTNKIGDDKTVSQAVAEWAYSPSETVS